MKRLIFAVSVVCLSALGSDLPSQIRNVAFTPYPVAEVAASFAAFQSAFRNMEAALGAQTPEIEKGWRDHLNVAELADIAAGKSRSVETLDRNLWWYFRNKPGLEMPHMLAVREAGRRYREALYFSSLSPSEFHAEFTAKRDRLSELLTRIGNGQPGVDHQEVGQLVGWMERAKQMSGWTAAIRQQYEKPNFLYSLSDKFLLASFQTESTNRTQPVTDRFNGASISGTSTFTGSTQAVLTPHPSQANIDIVLKGTARTQSTAVAPRPNEGPQLGRRFTGENGVATVRSAGTTSVNTTVRLVMQSTGFTIMPAVSFAHTQTQILGAAYEPNRSFVFPRVEDFVRGAGARQAEQRANAQKAAAEQYASRRAEEQIADELSAQVQARVGERLNDINRMYSENLYLPFYRHEIFPKHVHFSTTANRISAQGWMAGYDQFANVSSPPALPTGSDVTFQAHDSAVNNFLESAYGWYEATDSYIENFAKTMYGEIPKELWVYKGTQRWSAWFERRRPATVKLGRDEMTVTFRFEKFELKDSGHSLPVTMTATYALTRADGKILFQRKGPAKILFGTNPKLTAEEAKAVQAFATPKLLALFPEAPTFPNLMLPEGVSGANLPSLENTSFTIDGGWISASWKVVPKKPETAKTP